ncbi:MAG TPA: nuclear transport factor 2 family protein, partial [Terriglobales bacterium]|nr:nuclear transport factor 2 family protein [Terriglobales bacterium]
NDAESKLLAMENAWNIAQKDHDAKALDALVAETFVNTDYDGTVENKGEFLASAKDMSYKFDSVGNTNVSVFFYNTDTAIVTGTYHTSGTHKGKPFDSHGRFTDTWVQINGKWLCVASATTHIQKQP